MGKVALLTSGETTIEGISRAISGLLTTGGVKGSGDLLVIENGTPNKTVKISAGTIYIDFVDPVAEGARKYLGFIETGSEQNVTITDNTSGSARIDLIVAYVDTSAATQDDSDNNGALKFAAIPGTPAATPAIPTDATVTGILGAGVPWRPLARVAVANGFTSIINANITDMRSYTSDQETVLDDTSVDFVATGLVWSQSSGLIGTMTLGHAYIGGHLINKPNFTHTFAVSKDTYIDLPNTALPTVNDDLTYTAVTNGAAAPALAAGSIRLAKVVTNGSAITGVTDLRVITPIDNTMIANRTRRVFGNISPENSATYVFNNGMTVNLADETTQGAMFTIEVPKDYVSGGALIIKYSAGGTGAINISEYIGVISLSESITMNEANNVSEVLGSAGGDTLYEATITLAGGYTIGDVVLGTIRRRAGDANAGALAIRGIGFEYTADM
jgi:hypothetical protein